MVHSYHDVAFEHSLVWQSIDMFSSMVLKTPSSVSHFTASTCSFLRGQAMTRLKELQVPATMIPQSIRAPFVEVIIFVIVLTSMNQFLLGNPQLVLVLQILRCTENANDMMICHHDMPYHLMSLKVQDTDDYSSLSYQTTTQMTTFWKSQ